MSRVGRYFVQRKKVAELSATSGDALTLKVANCGTEFKIDQTTGYDITLPQIDYAGQGWWAVFTVTTAANATVNIQAHSEDADKMFGAQYDKTAIAAETVAAGTRIYGVITSITLTSGACIAYRV